MPLLIPAVSAEKHYSKSVSGTILSSFFWGYTLTQVSNCHSWHSTHTDCPTSFQVLGGYFSDKYGGQKVIYSAAIVWSIITFLMPNLMSIAGPTATWTITYVVIVRIINGAAQGVHFPAMMSVVSQNLNAAERTSFFSLLTSGGAIGTLLTGTMGSLMLDYFGWATAFRIFGLMGISWALFLRHFTLEQDKSRIVNLSDRLMLGASGEYAEEVPWLKLLTRSSVWACILTHACQNNCFFVLLSWMPTYFHDNFPHAKGWVANMIPWMVLPFCTLFAKVLTDRMIASRWSLTATRKTVQSICFAAQIAALLVMMTNVTSFGVALTCMTVIIGGSGFHNAAVTVNPQDLAPRHSGSVFGLMNTVGAIPGFLGVYLAGHILELTQSWPAVFSTSIAVNVAGWIIFVIFGSAEAVT